MSQEHIVTGDLLKQRTDIHIAMNEGLHFTQKFFLSICASRAACETFWFTRSINDSR